MPLDDAGRGCSKGVGMTPAQIKRLEQRLDEVAKALTGPIESEDLPFPPMTEAEFEAAYCRDDPVGWPSEADRQRLKDLLALTLGTGSK
jgi:hypothetical protein